MPAAMVTLRTSRVEKVSSTTRYGGPNGLVLGIPRPVRSHHVPLQRNITYALLAKQITIGPTLLEWDHQYWISQK